MFKSFALAAVISVVQAIETQEWWMNEAAKQQNNAASRDPYARMASRDSFEDRRGGHSDFGYGEQPRDMGFREQEFGGYGAPEVSYGGHQGGHQNIDRRAIDEG